MHRIALAAALAMTATPASTDAMTTTPAAIAPTPADPYP